MDVHREPSAGQYLSSTANRFAQPPQRPHLSYTPCPPTDPTSLPEETRQAERDLGQLKGFSAEDFERDSRFQSIGALVLPSHETLTSHC